MTSPQISVVMPVYNEKNYVSFAVDSILNQTFSDFELIIIDGGSDDGTLQILESFDDPRIYLIKNAHNNGIAGDLNKGIERADAGLIARMDADDIAHPNRLKRQANYLDANPQIMVVGSSMYRIDIKNRIIYSNDWKVNPKLDVEHILNRGVPSPHPSILMRKHVIERVGGYRDIFKRAEDLDFWLRLAEIFSEDCIHNLPARYLFYRVDGGQLLSQVGSNSVYSDAAREAARLRLQGKNEDEALHKIEHIDTQYLQQQSPNMQNAYEYYSMFRHHMIANNHRAAFESLGGIELSLSSVQTLLKLFMRDLKIKIRL